MAHNIHGMEDHEYLLDLTNRLFRIPVVYGVNGSDIDSLGAIAKAAKAEFEKRAAAGPAMKLSPAQRAALVLIAKGPMARGLFSGWGPHHHGYGAHRIDVREATAAKLIELGAIEMIGEGKEAKLSITQAGRDALKENANV